MLHPESLSKLAPGRCGLMCWTEAMIRNLLSLPILVLLHLLLLILFLQHPHPLFYLISSSFRSASPTFPPQLTPSSPPPLLLCLLIFFLFLLFLFQLLYFCSSSFTPPSLSPPFSSYPPSSLPPHHLLCFPLLLCAYLLLNLITFFLLLKLLLFKAAFQQINTSIVCTGTGPNPASCIKYLLTLGVLTQQADCPAPIATVHLHIHIELFLLQHVWMLPPSLLPLGVFTPGENSKPRLIC